MKEFWNDRYKNEAFAYGEEPNEFFKAQLTKLNAGKILLPAEGEGRNGVYAAKLGWEVTAFDISEEGKNKAEQLARKNKVTINYIVDAFNELKFEKEKYDAIGLIYAHFPPEDKSNFHKILNTYLKKGGMIIFEAFSKKHLKYNLDNPKAGGPKNEDILFSIEELRTDFDNYEILELSENEIELNEGLYHIGLGSVIRFVGRKR